MRTQEAEHEKLKPKCCAVTERIPTERSAATAAHGTSPARPQAQANPASALRFAPVGLTFGQVLQLQSVLSENLQNLLEEMHLPLIFGGRGSQRSLGNADLLVIDEDPLNALLINSLDNGMPRFNAARLLAESDPTAQALGKLLREAESGNHEGYETFHQDLRKMVSGYGLYGEPFLQRLQKALSAPHAPVSFERALHTLAPGYPDLVRLLAQTFDEDLIALRLIGASQRLGIHGISKKGAPGGAEFFLRYNLRRSLDLTCPTLVLDAYAHPAQYRALFSEHPVMMHSFDPGPPLQVEYAPMLHLDPYDEGTQRRLQARQQIAEELLERKKQNPERGQLLITPSRLAHAGSQWKTQIDATYAEEGFEIGVDASTGYWFAGRGQNQHEGSDVIALNAPRLPRLHREYNLAALFSLNGDARSEVHQHLEGTEYLQLLHRGRQHRPHGTGTPRVIVAEAPDLSVQSLSGRMIVSSYQPTLDFVHSSNSPWWRDAVRGFAQDALEELGGVPREALISGDLIAAKRSGLSVRRGSRPSG